MKRRLMIARALIHEPRLLILDEPTAGVDIEIRRAMWDFLKRTNEAGTTIILTTHYLEEAESLCRHVAIIDKGKIIENAPMSAVLRKLKKEIIVLSLRHPVAERPDLDGFDTLLRDDGDLEVAIESTQRPQRTVWPAEPQGHCGIEPAQQDQPPRRAVYRPGGKPARQQRRRGLK